MANEQQKCPICSTKLKMINGRMTCKECGYYIRNDAAQQQSESQSDSPYITQPLSHPDPRPASAVSNGASGGHGSMNGSGGMAGSGSMGGAGKSGGSGVSGNSGAAKRVAIALAVIMICTVVTGIFYGIGHLSASGNRANKKSESGTTNPGDRGSRFTYMPQSDFFRALASVIFDKDLGDITEDEYASLTALEIDYENYEIYYQIDAEEGNYLSFYDGIQIYMSDLKYFPGLQWVSLVGEKFEKGDLDGLENLYAVYSKNTLAELASIVPYPENITELSVYDTIMEHSLTGVQKFPNLEYLSVQYYGLTDISALNDMPGLLGLALVDCNTLTDFGPLMNMTGLEKLSISTPQLKTIDFVSVMPNLTYLRIEESQIPDIKAVANCPNLTQLHLVDNYYIKDYNVVGDLTHLTDLTIYKDADSPIPSLGKLTELERVSIKNLWEQELPLVAAAGNINQLYLENNYDDYNLAMLANLPLTQLSLVDCSISGNHPLAFLKGMTDLVYLDLTETYVFGNMEDVFGIPALEYLYLKEVNGVIDFDNMPTSENLLLLDISGLKMATDAWSSEYYDINDHYELFEKFPNVEYLYAASLGINNIDFVTNMPNLQWLNIIKNNVTSLKPLEELSGFRAVLCGDNTILENVSEESGISVDTETEYYSYR